MHPQGRAAVKQVHHCRRRLPAHVAGRHVAMVDDANRGLKDFSGQRAPVRQPVGRVAGRGQPGAGWGGMAEEHAVRAGRAQGNSRHGRLDGAAVPCHFVCQVEFCSPCEARGGADDGGPKGQPVGCRPQQQQCLATASRHRQQRSASRCVMRRVDAGVKGATQDVLPPPPQEAGERRRAAGLPQQRLRGSTASQTRAWRL